MVSTAVWGSYLVCTSISYFTTGILHYLIYNVLRRAMMEKYALAYHAAEFEIIGTLYNPLKTKQVQLVRFTTRLVVPQIVVPQIVATLTLVATNC